MKKTNNGKKGGFINGKPHYSKSGKSLGGVKAFVSDESNPVELEGGEVIINKKSVNDQNVRTITGTNKQILNAINTQNGNGVPILKKGGYIMKKGGYVHSESEKQEPFEEVTNACIEEAVSLVNHIQEVSIFYVINKKLVIVFENELNIDSSNEIQAYIPMFHFCDHVFDITSASFPKNNKNKVLLIDMIAENQTVGKFADGGIAVTLSEKNKKFLEYAKENNLFGNSVQESCEKIKDVVYSVGGNIPESNSCGCGKMEKGGYIPTLQVKNYVKEKELTDINIFFETFDIEKDGNYYICRVELPFMETLKNFTTEAENETIAKQNIFSEFTQWADIA